jgi:hypothetical protein
MSIAIVAISASAVMRKECWLKGDRIMDTATGGKS